MQETKTALFGWFATVAMLAFLPLGCGVSVTPANTSRAHAPHLERSAPDAAKSAPQAPKHGSLDARSFKLPLPGNHSWPCTAQAGGRNTHNGNKYYSLDFGKARTWPANQDIPVYAMHSGKVLSDAFYGPPDIRKYPGPEHPGFPPNGYFVRIDMDQDGDPNTGLVTVYCHLKYPPRVSVGSVVNSGTILGYMGSTGETTGPHLHFTMRYNGDGSYGTGRQGQTELEKVLIEGVKIRDFRARVPYRSSR